VLFNSICIFKKKEYAEFVCPNPFKSVHITPSGSVYMCCPAYIKYNEIGNIFKNNLEEIWRGKKAEKIRAKIRCGDYSMCSLNICNQKREIRAEMLPNKLKMPEYITLAYDTECSLRCITCRDKELHNKKEQTEKIDEFLLPYLKEARFIIISGSGEAFYSPHSRALIKKIAALNKTALWNINTNGLLFNAENCRALGIEGRINEVLFSLPAYDRALYEKIMRGSDYYTVIKNIKAAAAGKMIKQVSINAVISSINYREIPALAQFAGENGIYLVLSQFHWWKRTKFGRNYKSVSVWDKNHSEFENFKKILNHPALNYEKIYMPPLFAKIREME